MDSQLAHMFSEILEYSPENGEWVEKVIQDKLQTCASRAMLQQTKCITHTFHIDERSTISKHHHRQQQQ